ncbi:hypothetical protein [Paraburkholderia diazotrophica]|uniref:hypothetical protein n=1 Tax=Paraburkholderia diazotrophica TaxID=667676 RepID=UPI00317F8F04
MEEMPARAPNSQRYITIGFTLMFDDAKAATLAGAVIQTRQRYNYVKRIDGIRLGGG